MHVSRTKASDLSKKIPLQTATVTVYTRHSPNCSKKKDPTWKRCKCRKYLYIYEAGKDRRVSAKTHSWEEAEALAKIELAKRDPIRMRLEEFAAAEAAKEAEEVARQARRTTTADALAEWRSRKGPTSSSTSSTQHSPWVMKPVRNA